MSKVHEIYIRQWLPHSWSWCEPWRYVAWAHGLTHRVMSSLTWCSLAVPWLDILPIDGPCPVCPSVLGQPLSRRHM